MDRTPESDAEIYADTTASDEVLASIDWRLATLERILLKLEPLLDLASKMADGDLSKKDKVKMVLNARRHQGL